MTSYDTILCTSGSTSMGGASTFYYSVSGTLDASSFTTETDVQITARAAGTVKNLLVRVITASASFTRTVTSRKNLADGNLAVTLSIGTTGLFEDTTHTDSVVAGDEINTKMSANDANTPSLVSITYLASTDTATMHVTNGHQAVSFVSQKFFTGLCGPTNSTISTESLALNRQRAACSYKYLFFYSKSNSSSNAMGAKSRKNSANGNLTITLPGSTSGIFEDTTNTDTIAAGDDYCLVFDGTGMNSTTNWETLAVTQISTDGKFLMSCSDAATAEGTIAAAITRYIPIMGRMIKRTTESDVQLKIRVSALKLKELVANIVANTVNGTSTIRTRVGAANGAQSLSIGSSTTGVFNDSTNNDTGLTSTSLINYSIVTGGSTGTMSLNYIGVIGDPVTSTLFSRTISESSITASAATIVRKAIRPISTTAVTVSQTLFKKATKVVSEGAITVTGTVVRKVIRPITTTTTTVSDSIANTRKYFRTLTESLGSITGTVVRKVIRPITTTTTTVSAATVTKKAFKTIAESAITVTGTVVRKPIRPISEPAKTISDTSPTKKAYKTILNTVTLSTTLLLKVIRPISEPAITVGASSLTSMKRAIRPISTAAITVADGMFRFVNRIITEPAKSASDSVTSSKHMSRTISESSITVSDAFTFRKVSRAIAEGVITVSQTLFKKVTHFISESSITASTATILRKVIHFLTESAVTVGASSVTRQKKAVRTISATTTTVSDNIVKSAIKHRTITEGTTISVSDNIVSRIDTGTIMTEPLVSVSDTITRHAHFYRTLTENPTPVSDTVSATKIQSGYHYMFKVGRRFPFILTDDERVSYKHKTDTIVD